ncbi:ATP-dependent RNA helicase HAS1 [Eumeta japonica]|uniref:ATP-dependent RNA helicase n=1 Tax=Eumeta variegata TaxID=151549 RepID=A0A4C2A3F8_EUMVA|nr:ATP-dependent RNA helicase HAS1 [Eumeta japonica]
MTTVETDTMTDIFLSKTDFCILEGNVDNRLLSALRVLGFTKPTRIQALTLPHLLLSKDLIGAAKTGSGKTLAYLIPVLNILIKLGFRQKHGTGSIILAPTRELALQIYGQLNKLLAEVELTCALIVGGEKKKKEIDLLSTGVNIVVATPGRLLDHLTNTEAFVYKNLKCLVVDEADKLLEAGFERCITAIIQHLPNVAARGLDIPAVDWIIQFDPPSDPKVFQYYPGITKL